MEQRYFDTKKVRTLGRRSVLRTRRQQRDVQKLIRGTLV
jgi:hypothetical protein